MDDSDYSCDELYPYRMPNGGCNNLNSPWWGTAQSPYKRLAAPDYDNFFNSPRVKAKQIGERLPNARLLAFNVLPPNPVYSELSNAFTYFAQFVAHDLVGTLDDGKQCYCHTNDPDCFNIPILASEQDDTFAKQSCIPLRRNLNSEIAYECEFDHREQMSKNTHWLDNDQMYGQSKSDLKRLRAYKHGLLKSSVLPNTKHEGLPIESKRQCKKPGKSFGCFFAGDNRVESSVMLTSIQTVVLRFNPDRT